MKPTPFPPHLTCCYLYIISRYGYPPPADQSVTYLKEMSELGFQSVELEGIREDHIREMYKRRTEIKEEVDRLQLRVPYYCIVLPELGSAKREEREKALALFELGCETAAFLGAQGVLDNAPLPPYQFPENIPIVRHYEEEVLMSATFPSDLKWNMYWSELTSTYQLTCDIAARYGLTYHLHPCMGVLAATTDAYLYFADAVNRDNLRFNLDTANQFAMKDNLSLSLLRLKDRIDYIHLSDNGGKRVEHLVPGKGVIHWDSFFETLDKVGFQGHIGIDVGGAESQVGDIREAYQASATWVMERFGTWHS